MIKLNSMLCDYPIEEMFLKFKGQHLRVSEMADRIFERAFPWVNLDEQYRIMDAWMLANPRRRPRNQTRFVMNWLQKQPRPAKELTVGQGPVCAKPVRR